MTTILPTKTNSDNFRAQIDCVLIDTDYNGKSFNIAASDLPAKKTDLIKGEYELPLAATVAVKIVDMLGEEVLMVRSQSPACVRIHGL